jgi:hypothetical protein
MNQFSDVGSSLFCPSLHSSLVLLPAYMPANALHIYGSREGMLPRFKYEISLTRLTQNLIFDFRSLTLHQKSKAKLIIRDSAPYKAKHYRAHWQPFCAWVGLVGCIAIIIFSGWPAIHVLRTWDSLTERDKLKSKGSLGADVAGAYAGVSIYSPSCLQGLFVCLNGQTNEI